MERLIGFFNNLIDKKDIIKMRKYFPNSKSLSGRMKVELDLSNYATKADLKNCNRCWYIGFC